MSNNYLRTAFRSLARNKTYSILNIAGLALGISVCMILFIMIQFHASFDNFHKNKNAIYRVLTEYHHADSKVIFKGKGVPFGFPNAIKNFFPQVKQVAPLFADHNDQLVLLNSKNETVNKFKEENGVFYTSPSFFSIFDFPLLAGSCESLKDPDHVLLTKETAEKYYGNWRQAMGKTIKLNNTDLLEVTGILATIPANTDFQFKAVISYGTGFTKEYLHSTDYDGTRGQFGCFILLPPNVSASGFDKQLRAYSAKLKTAGNKDQQTLQFLGDAHYDTEVGSYSNKNISYTMISILWLIAAFILLIACVNFINLSTAIAVNRAKEVGVRKVLGSNQRQLQLQFLAETFLLVMVSVVLALAVTWAVLPYVNRILELPLRFSSANALSMVFFLFLLCMAVTGLAGFYPAVVLSGFNPIHALKSKPAAKSKKGISLRRGLVVFQFVIAQSLIIGTMVIVKQMDFFTGQPLGFDKEAIVNIPLPTDSISNSRMGYLRQELKSIHGIQHISFDDNTPVEDEDNSWSMFYFNHAIKMVDFYSIFKLADNDYIPLFHLPLVAGRNMEASDTVREFLVNEMLVKNLGIQNPQDALNREISFNEKLKGPIVGVVKDFHTRSFRDGNAPVIITSWKKYYNEASIKFAAKDVMPVMRSLEKIWNSTYPDFVFEYKFLDDKIESFYKQENQLAHLYKIFAFIAILLSCLGLYGLASFMAVQRIKEVGIRKVLGATASHIVYLFSKEFVLLISLAFVMAVPVTWYFMHQWLQNYAFRIHLSWWIFLAGGLASVMIALITVSFQAIKAATANPVNTLIRE